ncbi:alpha/beta hydrolase [Burkholderia sp. BCC1977]|uniref:alpha/beta fold hydrolase n=1 Tax=Burkholderia sp. BCC1977 TaxID=2817440 RepID=UPI002ABD2B52|nr:alpha/beta hydrolase [Burkholderia sp. BCC1977]
MGLNYLYGANISANGIRQHYLRFGGQQPPRGERPALVVIPGITSPAASWGFVGEVLGEHFDTYVTDVRGRGLSEASSTLDYSLKAQADDLLALVDALALQNYSFVGHSMGARIAARAARHRPAGLRSVVLVDPPVSGPGRRPYPSPLQPYLDALSVARDGTDAEGMRRFCPTWTESQRQVRAEWLHTCDERAVIATHEGFHQDDFHSDVAGLASPALLITAEFGDVVRDEDVHTLQELLPSLRHARVRNAGHMIPWDNAEGFYEAFGSFLGTEILPSRASDS